LAAARGDGSPGARPGRPYQSWALPQTGQLTEAETDAENTMPQQHV
jgi:hypothetical protein